MQKSILKRALSLVVCLAVLIAGMPLAVLTASAETPANVVADDFESGEVKWIRDDEASIDAERIVDQSSTNTNKVFNPKFKEDSAIGSVGAYTYAGETPDTKLVSVSGRYYTPTTYSLVLIYYYKDANNWRGVSIGTGSQWLRFTGRETLADSSVIQSNFLTYDPFSSHRGTFEENNRLYGASIDFTITYAEDGTVSMVLSRTTDDNVEQSTEIPLPVYAFKNLSTTSNANHLITGPSSDATTISFSSIQADIAENGGCFAFGNAGNNDTWVDNIVMTYEKTDAEYAAEFKATHEEILAKTAATVTDADKDAIANALSDYEALTGGAKDLLTAEYALLNELGDAIIAGAFNVGSFTDDFSGDNYWVQVGDGAASSITDGKFYPGANTNTANGQVSIYTHKYWPDRQLKKVSGTVGGTGQAVVLIYYYKDKNNWRGVYFHGGSYSYMRLIMKETVGEQVYYRYTTGTNDHTIGWSDGANTKSGPFDFTFEYGENGHIEFSIKVKDSDVTGTSKYSTFVLSDAFISKAADTKVLGEDGVTFETATESHTFAALTDSKSSEFAIGRINNSSYVDDITVTFEKGNAEYAAEFKDAHKDILAKTAETVAIEDKAAIDAALADYELLSDGVKALVATEHTLLLSLSAKIGELEIIAEAEAFKDAHDEILGKTSSTVLASDKEAVEAALADFEALSDEVKALLTTEKAILTVLEEAVIAAQFNVESFTDDFSGDNNWIQVGDGAASSITNEKFYPGANTDIANGQVSIYTHKYWPNRQLKEVSGTVGLTTHAVLLIYYYKDANNWRGIYFRTGSNVYVRYLMKESDATDPNKVYYYHDSTGGNSNDATIGWPDGKPSSPYKFTITYGDTIKIRFTSVDGTLVSNEMTLPGSHNGQKYSGLYASTDNGVTFEKTTESYTFKALDNNKAGKFAIGRVSSSDYVDDITVTFEETTENIVAAYLVAHEGILAKDVETVTTADKAAILAAIADYEALNADAKEALADEYALLSAMSEALYATTMDGATYTETFEDDYLWKAEGGNAPESVIKDIEGDKVFAPGGVGSTGAPVVYTHKYWQDKVLTSVTGKMYVGHDLTATYPSNVIIYNYEDENNWRGIYFVNVDNGQPVKFIAKENGRMIPLAHYYYKVKGDDTFELENQETTFTITYNENGSAEIVLTNETGSSITIPLYTDLGGFEDACNDRIDANFGAFGVASITSASANDWFDDITFNFGETFEQKADAFKKANADALALDPANVTNDDKDTIYALYDAYYAATRSLGMQTLLADEGAKVEALFDALIAANKNDTDVIRIACVGDSITESGNMSREPFAEVGYPYMLQTELDRVYGEGKFLVGNYGISGARTSTYYGTKQFKDSLLFDADIVVFMFGTNDVGNANSVFEYYYEKCADAYIGNGVDAANFVATTSIYAFSGSYEKPALVTNRESTRTLAAENGWSLFDMYADTYDYLSTHQEVYDSVLLHPVGAYDVLADAAYNYLDANLLAQFGFEKIVSEEFEEHEETYSTTADAVTADNLAAIEEALAKYETLTDAQKETYLEEKAALEQIKVVATFDKEVKETVVTPANVDVVAEKQAAYEALGVDNASIKDAIKALNDTVNSFSSQVKGCSIKADADPTKQDIRFEYAAPTWDAPEGWYVKEYGAIFYPAAALKGQPLTLETQGIASGKGELNPDGSVPTTFRANLVGSALKSINCAMDIAGTAYVIWTDGTYEYVRYSNNTVDNNGYTDSTVGNGIGVRSVYKTARKIATAIYGTTEYGEINYTEAVTAGGNIADFKDADILEFVSKNLDAITAYVGKNQNK